MLGALFLLASLLAWASGIAFALNLRKVAPLLPFRGMEYLLMIAHFLPWLIAMVFERNISKGERGSNGEAAPSSLARTILVVMLLLGYIALLNVEIPLTMALRLTQVSH